MANLHHIRLRFKPGKLRNIPDALLLDDFEVQGVTKVEVVWSPGDVRKARIELIVDAFDEVEE